MARVGGFTANLDPFGGNRGGLGRYNITGDTIQSLAEYEAYAVAVAWGNGTATDAEYLASLEKLLSLTTPGTKEAVTAQNRLDDAKYTIGRNKFVRDVNQASTPQARIAALKALQGYEQQRLSHMDATNSEAYREQQDRVTGAAADIRQAQYSDLVEKVNRGAATTQQLLDLATRLQGESAGQADAQQWKSTVGELTDRVADEKLSDQFQAYQHHRMSGDALLKAIDKRMGGLTPGSPAYVELQRQREDLAERVRDEKRTIADEQMAGKRSTGKVTDKDYLAYLKKQYEDAPPGTSESIAAGNRLTDYTFSLAEDKLRFDVTKGKRSVGDLIRFYKTYQRGMSPGSERWRQLQTAIDSLSRRGGVGGGGGGGGRSGGGGGGSGSGISLGPKLIGGQAVLSDLLGGPGQKAPPDFGGLLRIDVNSTASRKWFDNNLRSMVDAFQDGRGTWVYYDRRGNAYNMPFVPSMMADMDRLNVGYMHQGLAGADSGKEAQTWVGRLITATKASQSRGATYTMDVYSKTFAALERAKQQALAGGRYGEYSNLVREQLQLAKFILGTPDGESAALGNSTNPQLTQDQKNRILNDLTKLAPKNNDETSPFYNPDGDPVLGFIDSGAITTKSDPVTGDIIDAQLDPNRGYVTQNPDGSVGLVEVDPSDPTQFRSDPITGGAVPTYRDANVQVTVRIGGEDVQVWQPVAPPSAGEGPAVDPNGAIVVQIDKGNWVQSNSDRTNAAVGAITTGKPQGTPGSWQPGNYRRVIDNSTGGMATVSTYSTFTVEKGKKIKWISTDGVNWVRVAPGGSVAPQLVLDRDVVIDDQGRWTKNGRELSPNEKSSALHVWGPQDAVDAGAKDDGQWGVGAPGASFEIRKPGLTGGLDFRPQWVIDSEENQAIFMEARANKGPKKPQGGWVSVPTGTYEDREGRTHTVNTLIPGGPTIVRPRGNGIPDPGTNRPQASFSMNQGSGRYGVGFTDKALRGGEIIPKTIRLANAGSISGVGGFGGFGGPRQQLGVKPPPVPSLKPPADARLEPGSTPTLHKAPPRPHLPPKPKPKPTSHQGGAPGAYHPPAPKPTPHYGGAPGAYRPPAPAPKSSGTGSATKRREL